MAGTWGLWWQQLYQHPRQCWTRSCYIGRGRFHCTRPFSSLLAQLPTHTKDCAWPVLDTCTWPSWEQKSRSASVQSCKIEPVCVSASVSADTVLKACGVKYVCISLSAFYFTSAFVYLPYEMQVSHITRREIKFTLMATIILNYAESIWQKEQHVQTGSLKCNVLLSS